MTLHEKLQSMYRELTPDTDQMVDLFVVPLIRFQYKESDYLYLLYKEFIENPESRYNVHSTSVWRHWSFVWRVIRNPATILHYHWLESTDLKSLAGMAYKLLCIVLFQKLGGSIVWTVHNKMPHDARFEWFNLKICSSMARRANLIHVHCSYAAEEISRFYDQPISKFRVIPHPSYPATNIPRATAIRRLNKKHDLKLSDEQQIFLMFGNISSYKQIDKVVEMFAHLGREKILIVVGPVKKGQIPHYRDIQSLAEEAGNVRLIPHFIPEKEVPLYHSACNCVVFNYSEILTSGGIALAKSYNCPIIAPDLGCIQELQYEKLHRFTCQEELQSLLINFSPKRKLNA